MCVHEAALQHLRLYVSHDAEVQQMGVGGRCVWGGGGRLTAISRRVALAAATRV
jgi:hypothetical protein